MKDKLEYLRDWFAKARSDLKIARDEMNTAEPATDAVCFHFQQAVEKMLKAWLIWHEAEFKPIHNIEVLLAACEKMDPSFMELRAAEKLTPYAVQVRYADDFYVPPQAEMKEAAEITDRVEAFILSKFAAIGVKPVRENRR
jgi:HEPN domain-containing protein